MAYYSFIDPKPSGSSRVNVGQTERIVSAIAGGILIATGFSNIKKRPATGIASVLAGSTLFFRGSTGYCHVNEAVGRDTAKKTPTAISIKESLTINRDRYDVYDAWRSLENLPLFMQHLKSVKELTATRSHWVAQVPKGLGTIEWDADIVREEEGEVLSWKSVRGAMVDNAGEVVFKEAPGNRGTELHAVISYIPPAGEVGKLAAKLLNNAFDRLVREDMRRFKRMIETGELPIIKFDPSARKNTELPLNP
jgi:uncharacterized membrane protein